MTAVPKMRPGEESRGRRQPSGAPVMIPRARRTSTRASRASRTSGRSATSRSSPFRSSPRSGRGRPQCAHRAGARVHGQRDRPAHGDQAGQVAQAIENAKLYEHAQRRVAELEALAADSPRRSRSRSTSRSRSRRSSRRRSTRSVRRLPHSSSRTAPSRGPRAVPASTLRGCRCAGRAGRSESSSATVTRRSAMRRSGCSARSRTRPRSRSSMAALSCAASSLRRSITVSRTTCRPLPRLGACRRGCARGLPAGRCPTRPTASSQSRPCTRC